MASNVAKKEAATALATADFDMEQFAGAGLANVKHNELSTPFFRLLQALSPETKRQDPAYIPNAAEGMWVDVIGRAVYDSILFVPVNYVTVWMEWKPRSAGGGLVANHGADDSIEQRCHRDPKTNRLMTADGNEMVRTSNWYGIVVSGKLGDEETIIGKEAVIPLSGTQGKPNRKWLTFAKTQTIAKKDGTGSFLAPIFAVSYRLASVQTKNDQGSWALLSWQPEGWTQDIPEAAAMRPQILSFYRATEELIAAGLADAGVAEGAMQTRQEDTEIPF